jgi:hypothetical protein
MPEVQEEKSGSRGLDPFQRLSRAFASFPSAGAASLDLHRHPRGDDGRIITGLELVRPLAAPPPLFGRMPTLRPRFPEEHS